MAKPDNDLCSDAAILVRYQPWFFRVGERPIRNQCVRQDSPHAVRNDNDMMRCNGGPFWIE